VSRIEAGARVPSLQILREFANRLGVTADYLATGSRDAEGPSSDLLEAEVALQLGDEQRAAELYESARTEATSPAELARAQLGLGRLAVRRGDLPQGIAFLEAALEADDLGPADASAAADALGRCYASQSRFDEAFALFTRFLDDARSRKDQFDELRFALLLANAYVDHGEFTRAQTTLGDILDLARKSADPMSRAGMYWSQSRVHHAQGDADRAAEYAQLTIATLKASEQTLAAAGALLVLAFIENDRGNPQAALELVDEGEPIVASTGDPTDLAMFTVERARALSALGEGDQAMELLLGIVPRLNAAAPRDAARAYAAVAGIYRNHGDSERAIELYELAVEQTPTSDRYLAEALTAMAEIYEERGDTQKALELLKQALAARTGTPA
jgi:tetratricopeptide (TPR) repeat protein